MYFVCSSIMILQLLITFIVSKTFAKEHTRWSDFGDYGEGSRSYSHGYAEVDEDTCSWCTSYSDEISFEQRRHYPRQQRDYYRVDPHEDSHRRPVPYTNNKRHTAGSKKGPNEAASDWYPLEHFHFYTDRDDYHDPVYADLPINVRYSRKLPETSSKIEDDIRKSADSSRKLPDTKKVATGYVIGSSNTVVDKTPLTVSNVTADKLSIPEKGNKNSSKISDANGHQMMNDKQYQKPFPGNHNSYAWKSPGNRDTPSGRDPSQDRELPPIRDPPSGRDPSQGREPPPIRDPPSGRDPSQGREPLPSRDPAPGRDPSWGRNPPSGPPPGRDRDMTNRNPQQPDRPNQYSWTSPADHRRAAQPDRGNQYSWSSPGWRSSNGNRERDRDMRGHEQDRRYEGDRGYDNDKGRDRENPWKQPEKHYPQSDRDRFSSWKDRDDEGPVTTKQPEKEDVPAKLSDSPYLWKDREVRHTPPAYNLTKSSSNTTLF